MEKHSVEAIARQLSRKQVRYLIAGGLAVVAHGYVRFTADVDLLLAMDSGNLSAAVSTLQELRYRPRAPVNFEQFIDPACRSGLRKRDSRFSHFFLPITRQPKLICLSSRHWILPMHIKEPCIWRYRLELKWHSVLSMI